MFNRVHVENVVNVQECLGLSVKKLLSYAVINNILPGLH